MPSEYGSKAEADEAHSLLGDQEDDEGHETKTSLVAMFEARKKLRDERGFDETEAEKGFGAFLKTIKKMRDEHGGQIKQDKELSFDGVIESKTNILGGLAILSVVLYAVHMEINFNREGRYMDNSSISAYVMRYLMSVVTALMICALTDYYIVTLFIFRKFQCQDPEEAVGWSVEVWVEFFVQCAIIVIHPIPGLIDNKLGAFCFIRLYVLLLVLRNNSEMYTKRGIVYSSGHLKRGGKRIDATLCIKIHVDENPAGCLFIVFFTMMLFISYANFICEREGLNGEGLTYMTSLWNTSFLFFRGVSRMDNAGSTAGRAIELCTAVVGVVVTAIVVALVTEIMEVSAAEDFAITWMARYQSHKKAEVYAAELIQACWRVHQLRTSSPDDLTLEVELFFNSLIAKHSKFRDERKSQENLSLDVTHDKVLAISRDIETVVDDIEGIKCSQDAMLATFDDIDDYMIPDDATI